MTNSHNCETEDCAACEARIDQWETDRLMDRLEPAPLKNDNLANRGNSDSRYYDGI